MRQLAAASSAASSCDQKRRQVAFLAVLFALGAFGAYAGVMLSLPKSDVYGTPGRSGALARSDAADAVLVVSRQKQIQQTPHPFLPWICTSVSLESHSLTI